MAAVTAGEGSPKTLSYLWLICITSNKVLMSDDPTPKLRVLPLGGLGEIGLNMMIVVLGKDAFIIDTGLMFPDESMPGVDIVIPDLEVVIRQDWNVLGIVLTHGHEDHIGALPYVLKKIPAPIYATGLTMGLIEKQT